MMSGDRALASRQNPQIHRSKIQDAPVQNPEFRAKLQYFACDFGIRTWYFGVGILRYHPHVWMLQAEPSDIFHDFPI